MLALGKHLQKAANDFTLLTAGVGDADVNWWAAYGMQARFSETLKQWSVWRKYVFTMALKVESYWISQPYITFHITQKGCKIRRNKMVSLPWTGVMRNSDEYDYLFDIKYGVYQALTGISFQRFRKTTFDNLSHAYFI